MMIREAIMEFLARSAFMGYVVMGIMSFFLGICITLLIYRLCHRRNPQEQEVQHREL